MARFKIDSRVRQAAFLAQVGHESGQLRRLVENLNYSVEAMTITWKSRYRGADSKPNAKAVALARKPEALAKDAYAGRNGNVQPGDGWRFRGLLQITGRVNYRAAAVGLGLPLEGQPELLEPAEQAAQSAAWWWSTHGLNELARCRAHPGHWQHHQHRAAGSGAERIRRTQGAL